MVADMETGMVGYKADMDLVEEVQDDPTSCRHCKEVAGMGSSNGRPYAKLRNYRAFLLEESPSADNNLDLAWNRILSSFAQVNRKIDWRHRLA